MATSTADRLPARRGLLVSALLTTAWLSGCGGCVSEVPPAPVPAAVKPQPAAPKTFEVRSLTANGQAILAGGPVVVAPRTPVEIEGDIVFRKSRPPFFLVRFFKLKEDGRRVIADSGTVQPNEGERPTERLTFSKTLKAPPEPGSYVIELEAPPHSMWAGAAPNADRETPIIYATGELTVTE